MSGNTVFSDRYKLVAEANRRNYAKRATRYASSCACIHEEGLAGELEGLLRTGLSLVGDLGRPPLALDACGGSGNAALKMIEHGCKTTLADISPELIEICKQECDNRGVQCDFELGEIGQYLDSTDNKFDLITFSSALHHLENPLLVLSLATDCLSPGGVIVTLFDPCPSPRAVKLVTEPVRILTRIVREPSLLYTRTGPVVRRFLRRESKEKMAARALELKDDNVGFIAEYHGTRGINDRDLVARLKEVTPISVVEHHRYVGGHIIAPVKWMLRTMRIPNRFSLVLQKPR